VRSARSPIGSRSKVSKPSDRTSGASAAKARMASRPRSSASA